MQDRKKDKTPKNKQYQKHGYWERYWGNGTLFYKCNYVNGIALGFDETYQLDGTINYMAYHAR